MPNPPTNHVQPKKRPLLATRTNHTRLAPLSATAQKLAALLDASSQRKRPKRRSDPTMACANSTGTAISGMTRQTSGSVSSSIPNNKTPSSVLARKPAPQSRIDIDMEPPTLQQLHKKQKTFLKGKATNTTRASSLKTTKKPSAHASSAKKNRQPSTTDNIPRPSVAQTLLSHSSNPHRLASKADRTSNEGSPLASTSAAAQTAGTVPTSRAPHPNVHSQLPNNHTHAPPKPTQKATTFLSFQTSSSTAPRKRAVAWSAYAPPILPPPPLPQSNFKSSSSATATEATTATTLPTTSVIDDTAPHVSTGTNGLSSNSGNKARVPPPCTQAPSAAELSDGNGSPTPHSKGAPDVPIRPSSSSTSGAPPLASTYRPNLVRQNLRNAGGACRLRRAPTRPMARQGPASQPAKSGSTTLIERPLGLNSQTGTDPVDDFCDGRQVSSHGGTLPPLCQGHQQPCCVRTVRKSGSLHKGRQFYTCPLPRGEQCQHFAWVDDDGSSTGPSNAAVVNRQDSQTGFIQRQVQAYLGHLQALTLPELRQWAKARQLDTRGKRGQVWTRIALYVRDEITLGLSSDNKSDHKLEDDLEALDAVKQTEVSATEEIVMDEQGMGDTFERDEETDEESDDEELEIMPKNAPSEANLAVDTDCPLRLRLRSLFGHKDFRPGQEWTIRRCLQGQRTLLVAPTGMGKSLCYALPAAMEPNGVVLVVSPLLSLIQDQLRELPPSLPAASLSGVTPSSTLLQDLRRGRLRILFVSPERLVSPSFRRLLSKNTWNASTQSYERIMPPVSLFCVDEAHCLSQWGHNFRPCYLRLQSVLDLIQPRSVLAITATAGPRVINDITKTLGLPKLDQKGGDEEKGIKIFKADRDNIDVSVRFVPDHADRLNRLVSILSPRKAKADDGSFHAGSLSSGSVIVYVWRQMDAEAVAEYITSANVPGKVVVYHGGMDSGSRAKAQSQFLRGKARICVATVAFGLGINKSDVVGVIHMYLSNTPEHYLQEIGRAGRNGGDAMAIALVIPDEVQVRHSLSHSDLLAKTQVRVLLSMLKNEVDSSIDILNQHSDTESLCVGLSLQSIVFGCECKPETTETIFSILEARDQPFLRVLGSFYGRVVVAPKRISLEELSKKERVVEAIRQCCKCLEPPAGQSSEDYEMAVGFKGQRIVGQTYGSFCFSVAQCANCLGPDAEPRHVFAALRRLQENGQIEYLLDATPAGRYIHLRLNRELIEILHREGESSLDILVEEAYHAYNTAVLTCAEKVLEIFRILRRLDKVQDGRIHEDGKSSSLRLFQKLIHNYLEEDSKGNVDTTLREEVADAFSSKPTKKSLDLSVWSVVQYLKQLQNAHAFSDVPPMSLDHHISADYISMAVTKFLHGISPVSSSTTLCRQHGSFGSMQSVEFHTLLEVVQSIISY